MTNSLSVRVCKSPTCQKKFTPSIPKQQFCERRCYANHWYQAVKLVKRAMPKYRCPKCDVVSQLDFKPKAVKFTWSEYHCPACGNKAM